MITGYNTDVEHGGIVYHVQTEDKGLQTPLILSLVYSGGAILASKRSPYDDLIAAGFDEAILAERLNRQHKLICAAVRAGRLEDLKRMSAREPEKVMRRQEPPATEAVSAESGSIKAEVVAHPDEQVKTESGNLSQGRFAVSDPSADKDSLQLSLLEERELRAGESVTLRVQVSRASRDGQAPVPKARVVLKTLGTGFSPASTFSITDKHGVAMIIASLPAFDGGRAAILLRAEADGQIAELRRIIWPV